MAASLRCRIRGCDLDPCGVCRRCGDQRQAQHAWQETSREKQCYRRMVCERCQAERESPDHQWEPGPGGPVGGESTLECSRCGLRI